MALHPEFPYPLYLVLSEASCRYRQWLQVAELAIRGGVDIIQLREKHLCKGELLRRAIQLKKLTDRHGVPLIVNDLPEIADIIGAWGVHVGRADARPSEIYNKYSQRLRIGWSVECITQLETSEMDFVHHLGVSPVYRTATKTNTITTWGLKGLHQIRETTNNPLIAIGGINTVNAKKIYQSGADSIAVVSSICGQPDPLEATRKLKQIWKEAIEELEK